MLTSQSSESLLL